MPQFFVDEVMEPGREIEIRGGDAKHISQSLRLRDGDWLMLSDGSGRTFHARITLSSPRAVRALIEREAVRRKGVTPPVLALALASRDRFEWAIEKAIELGCRRIMPFVSMRSERIRIKADVARKLERWRKIAVEAAKQSGLPFLPQVDAPIDFKGLCANMGSLGPCLFLYEGEFKKGLRSALRDLNERRALDKAGPVIVIGPEGGFADEEASLAKGAGAVAVSIGQQILRVETAAITAIAVCQFELGNMDPT
ncbi:MAG: RsmE family RNA methyltransferase [bacterium]